MLNILTFTLHSLDFTVKKMLKYTYILTQRKKVMAKKLTIAKKLSKRKYRPAPKIIAAIYKLIMLDIVGG